MTIATEAEQRRKGVSASVIGFWLVSLSPVIVAGSGLHGLSMAFWRCWIGLAGIGVVAIVRKVITWEHIRRTALAGFFFGSSIGLFFWAAQITSIANASLITVLQPIVLMIAARYMFAEVVTARDVFWSMVAIAGAVVLVLAGDSSGTGDIRGDLLAAVSILLGAGYFIVGKRVLVTVPVASFMSGVFFWAGLLLTIAVVLSGEQVLPSADADWIRILGIAAFPGFGHLLLNFAQNKAPLKLMGVFQLIVPVNATIMAYWFLDQTVVAMQLVGMALVISALTAQALFRGRLPVSVDAQPA